MYRIEKHPTKELYRISFGSGNFEDWKIAASLNKNCVTYQRELEKLGAHTEVKGVPRNQWSIYQLWFNTEKDAQNAIEYFESELLMKKISKR